MKIPVLVNYVVFRSAYSGEKEEILDLQFSFPYYAIQFFNKLSRYIPKEYINMNLLYNYLNRYSDFGKFLKQVPRSMFSRLPSKFVVNNSCIVIRVNKKINLFSLLRSLPEDYFCDYAGYNLVYSDNEEIKIIKALGMSYEGVIRFEK